MYVTIEITHTDVIMMIMLLQEIRDKNNPSLQNLLLQETNSLGKLYVLNELIRKESLDDGEESPEERVEV